MLPYSCFIAIYNPSMTIPYFYTRDRINNDWTPIIYH